MCALIAYRAKSINADAQIIFGQDFRRQMLLLYQGRKTHQHIVQALDNGQDGCW